MLPFFSKKNMTENATPKAVDIKEALASKQMLRERRPETPEPEAAAAFATLAETKRGGIFAGRFDGESPWERHPNGDELVQVLAGETRLTILMPDQLVALELKAGMLTLVPQGCWHKFYAPKGVTVLTMTPEPTNHSMAEDPRIA